MACLIRATRDRFGTTILVIEHDVSIVMSLAAYSRILFEGRDVSKESCNGLVRAGLASVLEGRHCFASLTLEENLVTGVEPLAG